MFGFNLKKKETQKKNSFLTVDIGSQSVKCLAFKRTIDEEDQQHKIKLVGMGKEWLEPWSVRSGHILEIDKVAKALDSAIFKATEEIDEDIDDVIFGVSGDICDCIVTTAKSIRQKNDKPIKLKELEAVELKVINAALENAQERYVGKTGNTKANLELITTASVYTKIDEEEVMHPEGQLGSRIEMALFNAFTPKYYLKTLEELSGLLNLNIMAVTSNLYSLNECLKYQKENTKLDSVIIDVGSDTTDVAIIFGGGIVTTGSIPLGGSQVTKHLSNQTGLNFAEAEKRKYDYSFDKLAEEEKEETKKYLEESIQLWLDGLEVLFNNFEGIKTFSSDIYITGGGSKLPALIEALETKPWHRSIPFKDTPNFVKLNANNIPFVLDTTGEANKEEFVIPIALSKIFLEIAN